MLNNYNLSEQIRDCLRHAEDCAQKAAAQTDPQLKQDFLIMERRWLFLARSYGFTERLTNLSKRKSDYSPLPTPPWSVDYSPSTRRVLDPHFIGDAGL
jgi:hypothetical protein